MLLQLFGGSLDAILDLLLHGLETGLIAHQFGGIQFEIPIDRVNDPIRMVFANESQKLVSPLFKFV
jgi:hypothetical protein